MDALFSVVALLIVSLFVIVPAGFVLVAAFAYVRVQKGQPVDIGTGLSAYTVVLLGASALVLTLGVARLLTALMGEIAFDYTYGDNNGNTSVVSFGLGGSSGTTGPNVDDNRQSQDVATGLALVVVGSIAGLGHFYLRHVLKLRGAFDRGVEGAWDTLQALALGVVVLVLVATVFDETFSRAIVTKEGSSPGDTIAVMFAFMGVWAVYGYRSLGHLGVRFGRPKTSGGVPL